MKREIEIALKAYNRRAAVPEPVKDEWDEITAVESPQAMGADAKPHKRSGEYVKAGAEAAAEVERLKRACYK
jgi:hypothetical protein